MGYLIDTNVISELVKLKQNTNVISWFKKVNDQDLYLSVLTIGEIRKGVASIQDIKKKEKFRMWLDQELREWFKGRILPVDIDVANKWGIIQSKSPKSYPAIDGLIAATALHFDLILVTRNVKDFNYQELEIIDPFEIKF